MTSSSSSPTALSGPADGGDSAAADPAVPRLRRDLRVAPFDGSLGPDGRPVHVVQAGARSYLVGEDARVVLEALAAEPTDFAELVARCGDLSSRPVDAAEVRRLVPGLPSAFIVGAAPSPRNSPFLLKMTLIPASLAAALARPLAGLYSPIIAAAILPLAALTTLRAFPLLTEAAVSPSGVAATIACVAACMFFHELGHVAACSRLRCPHGEIGFGIYFRFPVLYADVSASWGLPRRQRLMVGAGGLYFQCFLLLVGSSWTLVTGSPLAAWLVLVNLTAMLHMLNPMFKMDGYWLFSDLSGIPNLHRRVRGLVSGWVGGGTAPGLHAILLSREQAAVLLGYCIAFLAYFSVLVYFLIGLTTRALLDLRWLHGRGSWILGRLAEADLVARPGLALQLAWLYAWPLLLLAGWLWIGARLYGWSRSMRRGGDAAVPAST